MSTTPLKPLLSDDFMENYSDKWNEGVRGITIQHRICLLQGADWAREHYEAARAKDAEEIAKWKGIVKGVHGALTDIGTVPVPAMDADLYDAVMSIRAKDAELIQRLVDEVAAWMQPNLDERFRGEQWHQSKRILDAAAAAGFTPTEIKSRLPEQG